jgi:hypothetical protein
MNILKPIRATRTYTQTLVAPPDKVFPLLCPVREIDWAVGWQPLYVFSVSGIAEPDCVFITPGDPTDAIWFVTRHEPEKWLVEMVKITPNITACRLNIHLYPSGGGCKAVVTYSYTSLGLKGNEFVETFTEDYYCEFMRAWEAELNYYLSTGRKLST